MNKPMTRRGRDNLRREAEKDLGNLKSDLVNDEVIDFAINLRGCLSLISEKYSSDAIVDLIPGITCVLNKLDTSMTLNIDLEKNLSEALEEKKLLVKLLDKEKNEKRENFEISLSNEEKADEEIKSLQCQVNSLREIKYQLSEEIKNKNEIINILKEENDALQEQLKANKPPSSHDKDDGFVTPKTTAKRRVTNEKDIAFPTSNYFSTLTTSTPSPQCSSHEVVVQAQVHRAPTPRPPPIKNNAQGNKCIMTNNKNGKSKKRLAILADSQGKDIGVYFKELEEEFDVFVYSKPGAKIKHVVHDGSSLIKDFTNEDYVILLAGTNDAHYNEPALITVPQGINSLLSLKSNTNVLINSIPFRYDNPSLNNDIYYSNNGIMRMIDGYKGQLNLKYADVNAVLTRRNHFTRHGLHYSKLGKRLLAAHLSRLIRQAAAEPPVSPPPMVPADRVNVCEVNQCKPAVVTSAPAQMSVKPNVLNTSLIEPCPDQSSIHSPKQTPKPPELSTWHTTNSSTPAFTVLSSEDFPPLPSAVNSVCNINFLEEHHLPPNLNKTI
jgi:hypothetical protein